jgi:hypothetical protein
MESKSERLTGTVRVETPPKIAAAKVKREKARITITRELGALDESELGELEVTSMTQAESAAEVCPLVHHRFIRKSARRGQLHLTSAGTPAPSGERHVDDKGGRLGRRSRLEFEPLRRGL